MASQVTPTPTIQAKKTRKVSERKPMSNALRAAAKIDRILDVMPRNDAIAALAFGAQKLGLSVSVGANGISVA